MSYTARNEQNKNAEEARAALGLSDEMSVVRSVVAKRTRYRLRCLPYRLGLRQSPHLILMGMGKTTLET